MAKGQITYLKTAGTVNGRDRFAKKDYGACPGSGRAGEYSTSSVPVFSRTLPSLTVWLSVRTYLLTDGAYQLLVVVLLIAASAPVPRHSPSSSSLSVSKVPAGTVTFSHPTY